VLVPVDTLAVRGIWLSPRQLAARLGVSVRTVKRWRLDGHGPRAVHLSAGTVRYPLDQVEAWERALVGDPS
jgi:predicted DNA-binding transcriptional regulator AlpA